jgi:hypothetical protein
MLHHAAPATRSTALADASRRTSLPRCQERIAAERKAREEAAQDVIFGLESVFTEPAEGEAAPADVAAEDAAPAEDLPLEA